MEAREDLFVSRLLKVSKLSLFVARLSKSALVKAEPVGYGKFLQQTRRG